MDWLLENKLRHPTVRITIPNIDSSLNIRCFINDIAFRHQGETGFAVSDASFQFSNNSLHQPMAAD